MDDEGGEAVREQEISGAKEVENKPKDTEDATEVTPKIRNRRWKNPNTRRGRNFSRNSRSHRRRSFSSSSSESVRSHVYEGSTSDSDILSSLHSS